MSYDDVAGLATDSEFGARVAACLTGEAVNKVGDDLGDFILRSPSSASNMFMPLVSSAPGFGDKYGSGGQEAVTDLDILASVQASWPRVAALYPEMIS